MSLNRLFAAAIAGTTLAIATVASAHSGGDPKHGGAVAAASELSFELTASGDAATLYIEDHGKPFSTAGMSGRLTVLNGTDRSTATLEPAGDNRMQAKGVKIGKGTKSVANVVLPNRKEVAVRFSHR